MVMYVYIYIYIILILIYFLMVNGNLLAQACTLNKIALYVAMGPTLTIHIYFVDQGLY
jgi:hypothetical protein